MCPALEVRDTLRIRNVIAFDSFEQERVLDEIVEELDTQGYIISGNRKMPRAFINDILSANIRKAFVDFPGTSTIFHGTSDTSINYKRSLEYQKLTPERCEVILKKDLVHGLGPRNDLGYSADEYSNIRYQNWLNIYSEMEQRMK